MGNLFQKKLNVALDFWSCSTSIIPMEIYLNNIDCQLIYVELLNFSKIKL
jgi:hypothetical protein